jgi:hypothetical protein
LDQQGIPSSSLFEHTTVPESFLRDPTFWLEAAEVEKFIQNAHGLLPQKDQQEFLSEIGRRCPDLRAWGILDSVLKMMPSSKEVMFYPQRFLSYFISPEPPVENLKKDSLGVSFDIPIHSAQYPWVVGFLSSVLESVPCYSNDAAGICEWDGIHVVLKWGSNQDSLFTEVDPGRHISPELIQSIVESLQTAQKEIEEKNRELQKKEEQLSHYRSTLKEQTKFHWEQQSAIQHSQTQCDMDQLEVQELFNSFTKLSDYLIRAQQLITLLIGSERLSPKVQAALRKVDWPLVQAQFPRLIQRSRSILEKSLQEVDNVRNQINESPRDPGQPRQPHH